MVVFPVRGMRNTEADIHIEGLKYIDQTYIHIGALKYGPPLMIFHLFIQNHKLFI